MIGWADFQDVDIHIKAICDIVGLFKLVENIFIPGLPS